MPILKMTDLSLQGKRLLIRQDLNVPINDQGQISSTARIDAALPTLRYALEQGAVVRLMSHLGRPQPGQYELRYSLQPVADYLSQQLKRPVPLVPQWIDGIAEHSGELVLLENVRFLPGEMENDSALSQKMAALCDIYVMDAFGTAHRAQASTYGAGQYAPVACAGPLLSVELEALSRALDNPAKPMMAIVGGSKVSSKLKLLESLSQRCDHMILGGGILNTFIAAQGYAIGQSLYEPELMDSARQLMARLSIVLPTDVAVAQSFSPQAQATIKPIEAVQPQDMILDIGPDTAQHWAKLLQSAQTLLWNGPVGVFEFAAFSQGTRTLAQAIADSPAFSIAGGGDTLAAIDQFHLAEKISYISTGGGAFLEFVEGKTLPAVELLQRCYKPVVH